MSIVRMLFTAVFALGLVTAVGCQSSSPAESASAMPGRAIVVSGGNTGAITVFVPSADNSHVEVLSSTGGKVCADCEAAAAHYFKTGELVAKCPTCGAIRTPVTLMIPSSHATN